MMAKRECPLCKEKVQEKATICKHCKSELPPLPPKKWYQTWKGLLLILFIAAIFGNILTRSSSHQPSTSVTLKEATQKVADVKSKDIVSLNFNGKDDEAVETVKRCKIPGTKGTVIQLSSGYFELAKSMGSFIEFEGWAGFQVYGSLYEVVVAWKANGEKKKARWDVDFAAKTIKPKNQEAFIFSGKKDLLTFL